MRGVRFRISAANEEFGRANAHTPWGRLQF